MRQGCVLSSELSNICLEGMFNEALEDINKGISFNGILLNNLRQTEDTVLLANTREGSQVLVNRITRYCERYGMALYTKENTITMIVSKDKIEDERIYFKGHFQRTYPGTTTWGAN